MQGLLLGTVAILTVLMFPYEAAGQWYQPHDGNFIDAIDRLVYYDGHYYGLSRKGVLYSGGTYSPIWKTLNVAQDSGYNSLTPDARYAVGNGGKIWSMRVKNPPTTPGNTVSKADLYCANYWRGDGNRLKLLAAGARGTIVTHNSNGDSVLLLTENRFPDLYDIFELGSKRIWAVGDSGIVVVSTDHGKTWKERSRTPAHEYRKLICIDSKNCLLLGRDKVRGCALIIHTNYEISAWHERRYPEYSGITDAAVTTGKGSVLIAGPHGLLSLSVDSGKTWQPCRHGTKMHFNAVSVGTGSIVATGRSPVDGHFRSLASSDSGRTWRGSLEKEDSADVFFSSPPARCYVTGDGLVLEDWSSSIHYPARQVGLLPFRPRCCIALRDHTFMVGGLNGTLARGKEGGTDWTIDTVLHDDILSIDSNGGESLLVIGNKALYASHDRGTVWETLRYYAPGEQVTRLRYISQSSCISVGSHNGQGVLKRSDDGGATWRTLLAHRAEITGFSVDSSDFIYACTADGIVLKTEDGGASWTTLLSRPGQRFRDISMGSRKDILLLYDGETVMYSADGGANWIVHLYPGEHMQHIKAFCSSYTVWGNDASLVRHPTGYFPRFCPVHPDIRAVAAREGARVAVAVGEHGSVVQLRYSASVPANTCYATQGPTLTHLNFNDAAWLDDQTMVAVGDSGIVLRGSMPNFAWDIVRQEAADGKLTQAFGLASGIAIAAGDEVLLRSDSTGGHWTHLPGYPGTRMTMFDDRTWITVSKQGDVYLSEDAGRTWGKTGTCPGAVHDLGVMGYPRLLALIRDESLGYSRFILYRSMDFGASWHPLMQTTDEIRRMRVFDESRIFLLGPSGIVHIGDDYGRVWRTERSHQRKTFNDVIRMYPYRYLFSGEDRVIDMFEMLAPVITTAVPLPVSSEVVMRDVYPNPASDAVTVNLETAMALSAELTLYNTLGEAVWTSHRELQPGTGNTVHVGTSGLPSGMYYLRLTGPKAADFRRLIIRR